MRINQNIAAFNSYRNLSNTNNVMGKSLEKLSSGFRINRAADDAAGLVISQGLRAQVSGLRQATRNAQDGISVVQTAEGALNEVHSMLNRMRDLAVQSVNASNDDAARTAANNEITELKSEIARIADTTKFGTQALLDGNFGITAGTIEAGVDIAANVTTAGTDTFTVDGTTVTLAAGTRTAAATVDYLNSALDAALQGAGKAALAEDLSFKLDGNRVSFENRSTGAVTFVDGTNTPLVSHLGFTGTDVDAASTIAAATGTAAEFQVGANAGETIEVSGFNLDALATGITGDVLTAAAAETFITSMDTAISDVSGARGVLGAVQNRFESTINNLQVTTENLAASESRIRDTDMALEMVSFTRHQILLQAGTAMLGQANQLPQSVLRLLG